MSAAETMALPEEVTEVTALIERARVAQASRPGSIIAARLRRPGCRAQFSSS